MVQELEGRQLCSKQNKTLEKKKKNHQKTKEKETEKRTGLGDSSTQELCECSFCGEERLLGVKEQWAGGEAA